MGRKTAHNRGQGRAIKWLRGHSSWSRRTCLIWPFRGGASGYGMLGYLGKIYYAHRMMCELAHGKPPRGYEASHSCGNGHKGCVNPRHLSWKTKSQNQYDRTRHGTKSNGWLGKLTQRQANEIRALKGVIPQTEIARLYAISRSNVSFIHCNKAWTGKPTKYSRFQAARISD